MKLIWFAFLLACVVYSLYVPLQISAADVGNKEEKKVEWTEEKIKLFLIDEATKRNLNPVAVLAIVKCESNFKKDVVSKTNDYGLFQINRKAHGQSMLGKGYSIYKWEDTVEYGLDLLKKQGYKPWYMSRHCHGYS